MFTVSDISWLEKKVKSSDWEHSKALSFDDFSNFLEELGLKKARPSTLYYLLQKKESEPITYEELIMFTEKNSKISKKQYSYFNYIFLDQDKDHDGLLGINEIVQIYRIYGIKICMTLAKYHIDKYDSDYDGKVNEKEAFAMISNYFDK